MSLLSVHMLNLFFAGKTRLQRREGMQFQLMAMVIFYVIGHYLKLCNTCNSTQGERGECGTPGIKGDRV